ncbi:hypothetical protein C8A01DRAFT_17849 [Parachaetomium inaequale]|uniref:C3H1-type domain-containing protein n=1 Tax=Parachaetomium inaequale TaxID=2588326 RepID=A0AAN6PDG7_9PEZI|nr:hypothetical protein C8A01DRAFT_17849 [Parachaetomium inaequale]
MDTLRELNPTEPFPKEHHEVPRSFSDRSRTPSTPLSETPGHQHHGPGECHPLPLPFENSKACSKIASPATDFPPSPPLESPPAGITMASLPLTPSHSPNESFASCSRSQPTAFDVGQSIPRLNDYCAELKALMGSDEMGSSGINMAGTGNIDGNAIDMDSKNSPSNPSHPDDGDFELSNDAGTPDDRQPYRHGQIGAFRHFPRFDQASRPIVSDNWRAKSAADSARPQLASLMTGSNAGSLSNPLSPVTPGHARLQGQDQMETRSLQQQPRSPFVYTPMRSPLAAPSNPNIAAFAQPSPNPPPTPVSLSTPITMAFPGRGGGGYDHAHHSSAGSFGTTTSNGYSPTAAANGNGNADTTPTYASTDLIARQISSLGLRSGNTQVNNNNYASSNGTSQMTTTGNGFGHGTAATLAVSVAPDTLGYCFVRPNGTRTRLVPVDMLPYQLEGIPAQENGNERLVALPVPAGVGADGRSSNSQVLRAAVSSPPAGTGSGGDAIQSQIDRILAAPSHPPSPPHHHHNNNPHGNPHTTTSNSHPLTTSQQHHNTTTMTPSGSKKMKIYCDKWVHEGVCAFTQQGCKYKHEMPSDKATQHQLGLFLGYPVWWKRRQGELARATQPASASSVSGSGLGGGEGGRGVRLLPAAGSASASALGGGFGSRPGSRLAAGSGFVGGSGVGAVGDEREDGEVVVENRRGLLSAQALHRGATITGGLAASRWSDGLHNPSGNSTSTSNEPGFARDRLLRPSWRTDSPRGYAENGLQSYDGAGTGGSLDCRELVQYRVSAAEHERGTRLLTGTSTNTPTGQFVHAGTPTDTRTWPWEEQHYTRRASQTQQYRPQIPSNTGTSSFGTACAFGKFPLNTLTYPYSCLGNPPSRLPHNP